MPDFYARIAGDLCRKLELAEGELVVDFGSNDGSGLVPFKNLGMEVVGIEISDEVRIVDFGLCEMAFFHVMYRPSSNDFLQVGPPGSRLLTQLCFLHVPKTCPLQHAVSI